MELSMPMEDVQISDLPSRSIYSRLVDWDSNREGYHVTSFHVDFNGCLNKAQVLKRIEEMDIWLSNPLTDKPSWMKLGYQAKHNIQYLNQCALAFRREAMERTIAFSSGHLVKISANSVPPATVFVSLNKNFL
jgi:hypothetical protein